MNFATTADVSLPVAIVRRIKLIRDTSRTTEFKSNMQNLVTPDFSVYRIQRIERYLDNASAEREISESTLGLAQRVLKLTQQPLLADLQIPDASYREGYFLFFWDKGKHHFEIEISPDNTVDFFYRNRLTGELWNQEQSSAVEFNSAILDKLLLFIEPEGILL